MQPHQRSKLLRPDGALPPAWEPVKASVPLRRNFYSVRHRHVSAVYTTEKTFEEGTVVVVDGDLSAQVHIGVIVSKVEFPPSSGVGNIWDAASPQQIERWTKNRVAERTIMDFLRNDATSEMVNTDISRCKFLDIEYQLDQHVCTIYYAYYLKFLPLCKYLHSWLHCRVQFRGPMEGPTLAFTQDIYTDLHDDSTLWVNEAAYISPETWTGPAAPPRPSQNSKSIQPPPRDTAAQPAAAANGGFTVTGSDEPLQKPHPPQMRPPLNRGPPVAVTPAMTDDASTASTLNPTAAAWAPGGGSTGGGNSSTTSPANFGPEAAPQQPMATMAMPPFAPGMNGMPMYQGAPMMAPVWGMAAMPPQAAAPYAYNPSVTVGGIQPTAAGLGTDLLLANGAGMGMEEDTGTTRRNPHQIPAKQREKHIRALAACCESNTDFLAQDMPAGVSINTAAVDRLRSLVADLGLSLAVPSPKDVSSVETSPAGMSAECDGAGASYTFSSQETS